MNGVKLIHEKITRLLSVTLPVNKMENVRNKLTRK